eukprot:6231301-Pyramimonas_sp.AAC.1
MCAYAYLPVSPTVDNGVNNVPRVSHMLIWRDPNPFAQVSQPVASSSSWTASAISMAPVSSWPANTVIGFDTDSATQLQRGHEAGRVETSGSSPLSPLSGPASCSRSHHEATP